MITRDNYQEKKLIDENASDEIEARTQQEEKLVAEEYGELAVRALHSAYGLDSN